MVDSSSFIVLDSVYCQRTFLGLGLLSSSDSKDIMPSDKVIRMY
jgi:hypothetical protein